MQILSTPIYFFLFLSLYFEVFLLITYFERRLDMKFETARGKSKIKKYPTVTVMVPCWNEEKTICKTIHSLLYLNYPKAKLKIMIIDDGSTDNTWNVVQKFKNNSQIEMYQKENGGKYTALNFGLSKVTSELVGCLDADSYVDKEALKNIVVYFENKKTMAVTPSVKVWKPKTIIQHIQRVEYGWGIFLRKMYSYMNALYVTPGPFSIFRREVFEKLGGYRHAHNTEDMEMAVRMQSNHFEIANAQNAFVYTVAPDTVRKLYKQRLRWTYGFIKNSIDYKKLFFKKEYGTLGVYVLPMATLSLVSALYLACLSLYGFASSASKIFTKISVVGLQWPHWNFDWFYLNTEVIALASVVAFLGSITILLISRKMSDGKVSVGLDMIYFLTLYVFIVPFWISKAMFNAAFSVKTKWR